MPEEQNKRSRKEVDNELAGALMAMGELTYGNLTRSIDMANKISALMQERNAAAPGAEFVRSAQPEDMKPLTEEKPNEVSQAQANPVATDAA